jgi:hypothetical protein
MVLLGVVTVMLKEVAELFAEINKLYAQLMVGEVIPN